MAQSCWTWLPPPMRRDPSRAARPPRCTGDQPMNTHHDAAIESGEVRAERNGKGTRYVLQVAKQDIDAKEVDRWRKLAAIPEARDAIDRAMQRKPGDWDTHPEPEVTVDNI